ILYAQSGQLSEAIAAWQKVLAIQGDEPLTHHNLAGALRESGQPEEALEHHQKALAAGGSLSAKDRADFHAQMAVTLDRMGRREEANAQMGEAGQLNPARYGHFARSP